MADRASKLFNDLLKIFGQDDKEYKELISDDSRSTLVNDDTPAGTTEYTEGNFVCLRDDEIGEGDIMLQTDLEECELHIGDFVYKMNEQAGKNRLLVGTAKGSGGFGAYTGHDAKDYETGYDEDLKEPDDQYNTSDNLVFATNVANGVKVTIGDYEWQNTSAANTESAWSGQSSGSSYGAIVLEPISGNWDSFAAFDKNGIINFLLSRFANADDKGGSWSCRYHINAFEFAFKNNNSKIIIAKNKSVYKDSIEDDNLVIRFNGDFGKAGGQAAEPGGGVSGPVKLIIKEDGLWKDFGAKEDNGIRNIKLPPLGIGDMRIGGTFYIRPVGTAPTFSSVFVYNSSFAEYNSWWSANGNIIKSFGSWSYAAPGTSNLIVNGVEAEVETKTYPSTGVGFQSSIGQAYKIVLNFVSLQLLSGNEVLLTFKMGNVAETFTLSSLSAGEFEFSMASDVDNAPLIINLKQTIQGTTGFNNFKIDKLEIFEITCP